MSGRRVLETEQYFVFECRIPHSTTAGGMLRVRMNLRCMLTHRRRASRASSPSNSTRSACKSCRPFVITCTTSIAMHAIVEYARACGGDAMPGADERRSIVGLPGAFLNDRSPAQSSLSDTDIGAQSIADK